MGVYSSHISQEGRKIVLVAELATQLIAHAVFIVGVTMFFIGHVNLKELDHPQGNSPWSSNKADLELVAFAGAILTLAGMTLMVVFQLGTMVIVAIVSYPVAMLVELVILRIRHLFSA